MSYSFLDPSNRSSNCRIEYMLVRLDVDKVKTTLMHKANPTLVHYS